MICLAVLYAHSEVSLFSNFTPDSNPNLMQTLQVRGRAMASQSCCVTLHWCSVEELLQWQHTMERLNLKEIGFSTFLQKEIDVQPPPQESGLILFLRDIEWEEKKNICSLEWNTFIFRPHYY